MRVQVAEAFHHAPPPKVENAYKHVGRAVTSAAITTAGSAFFLFFCTVHPIPATHAILRVLKAGEACFQRFLGKVSASLT